MSTSVSGTGILPAVFGILSQAHVDYVAAARDLIIAQWGGHALNAGIALPPGILGPPIRVLPSSSQTGGFVPPPIGNLPTLHPIDAVSGAYHAKTGNMEIYPTQSDWKIAARRRVQMMSVASGLRSHLGQLLFHETVHTLDSRPQTPLPPASTPPPPWLAYHTDPREVTAWSGSIAWELQVRGLTSMKGSAVARHLAKRSMLWPRQARLSFHTALLHEVAAWRNKLAGMNVPP